MKCIVFQDYPFIIFCSCTFAYEWPIVALNILGRGCSIGCLALCYVYSAEVFPTVTRNVGIGSSSVWVSNFANFRNGNLYAKLC